jgi:Na+-translocating ferredoxin:NAD+ oxidoreductase subunit B
MPSNFPVALLAAIATVAFALAWLLWPALRARFDEAGLPIAFRGKPIDILASALATVPFATFGDAHDAWLCWLVAFIGWSIATLLRKTPARAAFANDEELIEAIDRLLPQTQCGQCNHPGCRPYAAAIASGNADINQCPPGGMDGIRALAELLGREVKPLNPAHGIEKPKVVALIVEEDCIGCTKCIQACPVDAIIGAPKRMHTVIASLCTGCELCLPPCPVDCIELVSPSARAA